MKYENPEELFDKALKSYAREIGKYTINQSDDQTMCQLHQRDLSKRIALLTL